MFVYSNCIQSFDFTLTIEFPLIGDWLDPDRNQFLVITVLDFSFLRRTRKKNSILSSWKYDINRTGLTQLRLNLSSQRIMRLLIWIHDTSGNFHEEQNKQRDWAIQYITTLIHNLQFKLFTNWKWISLHSTTNSILMNFKLTYFPENYINLLIRCFNVWKFDCVYPE